MICYQLQCEAGHGFEGWFGSSSDFDQQKKDGLLQCPTCGHKSVEKAIMAPSVKRSDKGVKKDADRFTDIAKAIRNEIAETCDDVGDQFASEARAMYYGEKPRRGIYGKATAQEAKDMVDDGIPALPIPDVFNPKRAQKKLN